MNTEEYIAQWESHHELSLYNNVEYLSQENRLQIVYNNGGSRNFYFFNEILKCQRQGYVSEKLGKMFMELSTKISERSHYNTKYKDEIISTGVYDACKYYHGFNPYKSFNALAYMIQIIKSGHASDKRF